MKINKVGKKKTGLPQYVIRKTKRDADGTVRYLYYFQKGGFREPICHPSEDGFAERYEALFLALRERPEFFDAWGEGGSPIDREQLNRYFLPRESAARRRAKRTGREYALPKLWAADQYIRQEGRCALSGVSMPKATRLMDPFCPTIDRIDSALGYTPENCHLVALQINLAKNNLSTRDFVRMCRSVVRHAGNGLRTKGENLNDL